MGWKDLVKRWSGEDAARDAQRAEAAKNAADFDAIYADQEKGEGEEAA